MSEEKKRAKRRPCPINKSVCRDLMRKMAIEQGRPNMTRVGADTYVWLVEGLHKKMNWAVSMSKGKTVSLVTRTRKQI